MNTRTARCVLAALATAVLMLSGTAASAQTITGCYVPNSGTVYRIKAPGLPDNCRGPHVEFTWSLQGPAGAQGPQGEEGPQGPQGPAGTIAAASVILVEQTFELPGATFAAGTSVQCPAGTVATGGGGGGGHPVFVNTSMPAKGSDGTWSWLALFSNPGTTSRLVTIRVVCVPAS